jgi:hypothetical protein
VKLTTPHKTFHRKRRVLLRMRYVDPQIIDQTESLSHNALILYTSCQKRRRTVFHYMGVAGNVGVYISLNLLVQHMLFLHITDSRYEFRSLNIQSNVLITRKCIFNMVEVQIVSAHHFGITCVLIGARDSGKYRYADWQVYQKHEV